MLLLLHALIPCLAAYILHLFLYFLALSSLYTSFNILMEMFLLSCFTFVIIVCHIMCL